MKPKKNSEADLRKRSLFFLQLSLIIVLLAAYLAIEWKTFAPRDRDDQIVQMGNLIEAEEPVVLMEVPTPPVLPPPPTIAIEPKIIENDDPTTEDKIASIEDLPDVIVKMDDIREAPKDDEPIVVPYEFIEDVPIFPGCEGLQSNEERKKCMSQKITLFVNTRFNKNLGEEVGVSGVNRINVGFKIDKEGNIIDVQSRAPHPRLEAEAIRVINSLPKMEPGKQRGKPVAVSYYLPIIFQIQN